MHVYTHAPQKIAQDAAVEREDCLADLTSTAEWCCAERMNTHDARATVTVTDARVVGWMVLDPRSPQAANTQTKRGNRAAVILID
mgnify:CR=1 FL=1